MKMQRLIIKLRFLKIVKYISLFQIFILQMISKRKLTSLVNGEKKTLQLTMLFNFFNLGYTEEQKLSISVLVSLEILRYHLNLQPSIVLDTQALTEAIQRLKNNL